MSEQTQKVVALGIDFNVAITDLSETVIQTPGEDGAVQVLRLGDVCVNALMAQPEDDKAADGTIKLLRFNLARKIKGRDDDYQSVQINSKQKTMILELASKVYGTMIYGRLHEALEGTTETEED